MYGAIVYFHPKFNVFAEYSMPVQVQPKIIALATNVLIGLFYTLALFALGGSVAEWV